MRYQHDPCRLGPFPFSAIQIRSLRNDSNKWISPSFFKKNIHFATMFLLQYSYAGNTWLHVYLHAKSLNHQYLLVQRWMIRSVCAVVFSFPLRSHPFMYFSYVQYPHHVAFSVFYFPRQTEGHMSQYSFQSEEAPVTLTVLRIERCMRETNFRQLRDSATWPFQN